MLFNPNKQADDNLTEIYMWIAPEECWDTPTDNTSVEAARSIC